MANQFTILKQRSSPLSYERVLKQVSSREIIFVFSLDSVLIGSPDITSTEVSN